jgi:periplasmic protein TonB
MSFAQQQRNPTRQMAGIGFVVLLHALLIYALVNGLARKVVEVAKGPLETKIIQEIKPPPPDTPPPPPPKLAPPPPPFIPPPEVNIAQSAPAQNTITTVSTAPPPPAPVAVPAPPKPVVRTEAVIDARKACDEPEYPAQSRRLEETGSEVLHFLVDVDGRVIDSKIVTSSGHPRLDDAARDALSRCKFKPGTIDGKPQQSWAELKYTWKLD